MTKISHVVVDGSNIATEGRSTPSLAQLEDAVAELRRDLPEAIVIVVVDATFAHRIDDGERERFEDAALRRDYVSPPAGAIGRGDAFLLRIAERVEGTVLSNDSFQEFHGEHGWLFDTGRLLGATPVPGVGWIFVPRSPVRGARSHVALRDARKARSQVEKAIEAATKEAVAPDTVVTDGRRGRLAEPEPGPIAPRRSPQAVNEPLTFIEFVASHPLGVAVTGVVQAFTSHGAVVEVGEMRCYVPLSGLGDPAPRSAREVLRKGEDHEFVVTALDPQRRGVELALPEAAVVSGQPSEETVEADVALAKPKRAPRPRAAAPSKSAAAPAPASPRKVAPASKTAKAAKTMKVTKATTKATTTKALPAKATTTKATQATKTTGARKTTAPPASKAAATAKGKAAPAAKTARTTKAATATRTTTTKVAKDVAKSKAAPAAKAPVRAPVASPGATKANSGRRGATNKAAPRTAPTQAKQAPSKTTRRVRGGAA